MIFVLENMKKVAIERVDVIEPRKLVNNCGELLMKILLAIFHLAHVELAKAGNCITLVDYSWGLPLGSR